MSNLSCPRCQRKYGIKTKQQSQDRFFVDFSLLTQIFLFLIYSLHVFNLRVFNLFMFFIKVPTSPQEKTTLKNPPNKTNKAEQNKIMKKGQVGICNRLLPSCASSGAFKSMKCIAVLQVILLKPPFKMLQNKCRRLIITWTDDLQRHVLQRVHRNKGAFLGLC